MQTRYLEIVKLTFKKQVIMLNKTLLLGVISATVFAVPVLFCSNAFATAALSIPQGQQDRNQADSTPAATVAATNENIQAANIWDRSGVDRASVHLQILMQSNTLFSDNMSTNTAQKKPSVVAKKNQVKAASNS